jgi:RNA polymerase sigma factor (sigma-70 family)
MLKEETKIITDCIQQLKTKYQAVIVLYYFQDLSVKEIATTLDIREGTVKSRLYKSREKLKTLMNSNENALSIEGDWVWKEN